MPCKFTHFSIFAEDIDESREFYEELLGLERIPHPEFQIETEFLRCGNQQLHLFTSDDEGIEPLDHAHFGIHVDDFERVYLKAKEDDLFASAGQESAPARVFRLPDGSAQLYLRDPTGNLVEINYPDISELDSSLINVVDRTTGSEQVTGDITESAVTGGSQTGVYLPELLE